MAVPYQYEGYIYLGLGLLAVCVLYVAHVARDRRVVCDVVRRHPFLFLVVTGTWIYSLSNHVYVGSHRILAYSWPHSLQWVAEQYRAPGRFVWLPAYALVIYVWSWALGHFNGGKRFIVPALALVQLIDGGLGDWKSWRDETRTAWTDVLGRTAWRHLIERHTRVEQVPSYDCIHDGSVPDLEYVAQEVEYFASEKPVAINGVYSARPTRDCAVESREMSDPPFRPGTLYVVWPQAAVGARALESSGATCADFVWGKVCSSDADAIATAKRAGVLYEAPLVTAGSTIDFGAPARAAPLLRHGWVQADDGVWTLGTTSALSVRLEGGPSAPTTLSLRLTAHLCPARPKNAVDVSLNGVLAATLPLEHEGDTVRKIPMVPGLAGGPVTIQLRPHDVRSPLAMGCGAERGERAIKLHAMWVE
jgi:hypothetical protein